MVFDAATGRVVLFGGYGPDGKFFGDTWVWDGTTWFERFPATSPSPQGTTLAYDGTTKEVIIFGGEDGGTSFLSDTWTWNGTDWSQVQTSFTPVGRYGASMNFDPNFKGLVLFGGYFTDGPWTNQTWLFG